MLEYAPRRTSGRVQKMKEKREDNRRKSPSEDELLRDKRDVEDINERLTAGLLATLSGDAPLNNSTTSLDIKGEAPDYEEFSQGDDYIPPASTSGALLSPPASSSPPPPPTHPPPLSSTLRLSTPTPESNVVDEYDIDNVELDRVQNNKQSYISSRSYRKSFDLSYRRSSDGADSSTQQDPADCSLNSPASSPIQSSIYSNNDSKCNSNNSSSSSSSSSSTSSKKLSYSKSKRKEDIIVNTSDTQLACDAKAEEHEGKKRKKRHLSLNGSQKKTRKKRTDENASEVYEFDDQEEKDEKEELYKPRLSR